MSEHDWYLVSTSPLEYAYGILVAGRAITDIRAIIDRQSDGSWRWLAGDFSGQGIEPSAETAKAAAMYWMGQNERTNNL